MHIFLTGERRIGKSTAISSFLKHLNDFGISGKNISVGGFRTVFEFYENGRTLYMEKTDPEKTITSENEKTFSNAPEKSIHGEYGKIILPIADRTVVAVSSDSGTGMSGKTEAFNEFGSSVFQKTENCDIILMDELGFLEKDANEFKKAVFEILDGKIPVIGVIREGFPGWTKEVADRSDVKVLTVTSENRNKMPEMIRSALLENISEKNTENADANAESNETTEQDETTEQNDKTKSDGITESASSSIKIAAVIMASGRSVRFNGNKLWEPINGVPMIEMLFRKIPESFFERVSVVSGDEKILELAKNYGFYPVLNIDPENDKAVTIRKGAESIPENCQGCMFLVGDQPFLTLKSMDALCRNFRKEPDKLHLLCYKGKTGNPVIFPEKMFKDLMTLNPGESGKAAIRRSGTAQILTEADNPIELADIDYREDLENVLKHPEMNFFRSDCNQSSIKFPKDQTKICFTDFFSVL